VSAPAPAGIASGCRGCRQQRRQDTTPLVLDASCPAQHPTVQGSPCLAVHDHVACCPRRHGAPTLGSCPIDRAVGLARTTRNWWALTDSTAGDRQERRQGRRGQPRAGHDTTRQECAQQSRRFGQGWKWRSATGRCRVYCLGAYSYMMITSAAASWQTEATRNALAETDRRHGAWAGTDRRHELARITCSRASPETDVT
jgi:hypothetical protein